MKSETLVEYEHKAMSLCHMGLHVSVTVNIAPQDQGLIDDGYGGSDLQAFVSRLRSSDIQVEVNVYPDQNFERSICIRAVSMG